MKALNFFALFVALSAGLLAAPVSSVTAQDELTHDIYLPATATSGFVNYDPITLEVAPGDTVVVKVVIGFEGAEDGLGSYQPMAWMSVPVEAAPYIDFVDTGPFTFIDEYCYDDGCYNEYATAVLSYRGFWLDPVTFVISDAYTPGERIALYFHNVVYDGQGNSVANIVRGLVTAAPATPTAAPEEPPAPVALDGLSALLDAGLLEDGDAVAVEGYIGFFDVFEDAEFTERLGGGCRSDGRLNYPYYLYDATLLETNLGFTNGTYLPFTLLDEDGAPLDLDPEEAFGMAAVVTGTVQAAPDAEEIGAANWILEGQDVRIYGGDSIDALAAQVPGWLREPGLEFPAAGKAPGRQLTDDGKEVPCQYGIIVAGRPNTTVIVRWPPQIADRYWNDITFAAGTLIGMGVPAANIEVAFWNIVGTPLPGTGVTVTQPGTRAGIQAAVTNIVNRVKAELDDDKTCNLFLIVTDHGGGLNKTEFVAPGGTLSGYRFPNGAIPLPSLAGGLQSGAPPDEEDDNINERDYDANAIEIATNANVTVWRELDGNPNASVIVNFDETIVATDGLFRDDDFAALFMPLPVPDEKFKFYALMEQCFGGGFVSDMTVHVSHIASASSETQPSYAANTEGPYDEFLYHFLSALAGQDPYGVAVNADRDYLPDNLVTWREAFYYALAHDDRNETPQFR